MKDDAVSELLDSEERLVVVEAPAGCGKTFQGAAHARRVTNRIKRGRVLILTHTHSARAAFASQTQSVSGKVEIRTLDSLSIQIASAYHRSLDLPPDPSAWARQQGEDGFQLVAQRVAALLARRPMIAAVLADRFPIVIADEHQDSTASQHDIVMALHSAGSRLRVFGDPMQRIYGGKSRTAAAKDIARWNELKETGVSGELEYPHRWKSGSIELGHWALRARATLKSRLPIYLAGSLPSGLRVIAAENRAAPRTGYRLSQEDRKPIDRVLDTAQRMLVLSGQNAAVQALRAMWFRRFPIWAGHTRGPLGTLVSAVGEKSGDAVAVAEATVRFIEEVCVGFSRTAYGDRFCAEIENGCAKQTRGKPEYIQELARYVLRRPDHIGVALCLKRLLELVENKIEGFESVFLDYRNEFRDAVRLADFASAEDGFAELNRRRSFAHPMPPQKAISTIHKAKGLECDHALVIPCDAHQFSNTDYSRCKLYVALSRAKQSLTLVVSRTSPSPLFKLE